MCVIHEDCPPLGPELRPELPRRRLQRACVECTGTSTDRRRRADEARGWPAGPASARISSGTARGWLGDQQRLPSAVLLLPYCLEGEKPFLCPPELPAATHGHVPGHSLAGCPALAPRWLRPPCSSGPPSPPPRRSALAASHFPAIGHREPLPPSGWTARYRVLVFASLFLFPFRRWWDGEFFKA